MGAELKLTHATQRGDSTTHDVGDLAAVRAVDAGVRILEVDMVEHVAGNNLDRQVHLFVEGDVLAQRGIRGEHSGAKQVGGSVSSPGIRGRELPRAFGITIALKSDGREVGSVMSGVIQTSSFGAEAAYLIGKADSRWIPNATLLQHPVPKVAV